MKNTILVILAMLTLLAPSSAILAEDISPVEDKEIAHILANFSVLAEVGFPQSMIHVRIIEVRDHGECDGSPETCPESAVYIAVSEYGEYPEQKVFRLKKMHGWKFVEWLSFPSGEGALDYVVFSMTAESPAEDIEKKWWNENLFEIKVNYHQARIFQK